MPTNNRAERRAAAKAVGVKGQLVAGLVVVPTPVTTVTLAGAIVGMLQGLERHGGAPLEGVVIRVGSDHPDHPGVLVVEGKTTHMARQAAGLAEPLALGDEVTQ